MAEQENQTENLTFSLSAESLDNDDLFDLVNELREELEELTLLESVDSMQRDVEQGGAKGSASDLFALVIGGVFSKTVLTELNKVLGAWLQRNRSVSLKLHANGELAELTASSPDDFEKMLEHVIALKHSSQLSS